MLEDLFSLFFYLVESIPSYDFTMAFVYMFFVLLFFMAFKVLACSSRY